MAIVVANQDEVVYEEIERRADIEELKLIHREEI